MENMDACQQQCKELILFAQNIIIIHEGKLVADGTPEELQSSFQGQELVHILLKAPEDDVAATIGSMDNVSKVEEKEAEASGLRHFAVESQSGVDVRESLFHLEARRDVPG